jgi:peptidoglycan hydrolase-like protein with peptidoglycan-binding domain
MKPVRLGDRGPAVEDIQRRLRTLGYDLGPTGIDGVFFGRTSDAVRLFQETRGLAADGLVGDDTWSALVDASFTLGDRMLYLRVPHFHGHDVLVLQQALTVLGFGNGRLDAIFGPFCERAVREFQRNAGLPADGIVGADTVRSLYALRHVWEGKDPVAHSAVRSEPVRSCEALTHNLVLVSGLDVGGEHVADRVANLATAANPEALVHVITADQGASAGARLLLRLCGNGTAPAIPGRPVVHVEGSTSLAARLLTAVESAKTACPEVVVELETVSGGDEHEQQRAAVRLLDALCFVFD